MNKLIGFLALFLSFSVLANWQLDNQASVVSFTTLKKTHVAENHRFHQIAATISEQGKVALSIDLTSVDTKVAIRDQRMKEYLFNVKQFPKASFSAQVPVKQITALEQGSSDILTVTGLIELHGQKQQLPVKVMVTKVSDDRILVSSIEPILIQAQAFDLIKGINKLAELAKLPSITTTVPVSFVLSFTQ
ncbi:YceI family protein [Thalassotalea sp. G2M2-11]|uniref:YceI family protein n=1 Tax=Thalassotalea sp. G2M2-11 TaxID=2787627 RepID=UPI0019D0D9DD|nr:YceI family protein [Thalassotalea sp. G2M2-11]